MHALTLFVFINTIVTEVLGNQSVHNSISTYDKYQATTMMVLLKPFELNGGEFIIIFIRLLINMNSFLPDSLDQTTR